MATQTPSLKERQRRERQQLILQAAAAVLVEKGYDAMSMEEVANRVGISRAAIYLHFPSKDDLVYALLEYGVKTTAERLDRLLAEPTTPREKVRAVIERTCGALSQPLQQVFSTILQSPAFMNDVAGKRADMRALWRPTTQRLAAVLDEGKRTGDFDPDMPTALMVTLLSGLLTPWVYKSMVEEAGIPLPVVVNSLTRYFLKGIAADHPDYPDHPDHPCEAPGPLAAGMALDQTGQEENQTAAIDK